MPAWELGSSDQVRVDEASGEYRVKVRRIVFGGLYKDTKATGWSPAEIERLQVKLDQMYRTAEIYLHIRHDSEGWLAIGWTIDGALTAFAEDLRVK